MNDVAAGEISEDEFLGLVARLGSAADFLTPVGAGLLAALHLGICHDSRTFSRLFGIAHALVLREVTELASEKGLLVIVDRNARTQRIALALTDASETLLSRAAAP